MKKLQYGLKYRIYPSSEQAKMLSKWVGAKRFVWNKLVYWGREVREENSELIVIEGRNKAYKKKPALTSEHFKAFAREITKLKKQPETGFLKEIEPRALEFVVQDYREAWTKYWDKIKKGIIKKEKALYIERKKKGKGKISNNRLEFWGEPQFRRKGNRDTVSTDRAYSLDLNNQSLFFRKFLKEGVEGGIKIKLQERDRLYNYQLESREKARVLVINELQNIESRDVDATPKKITISKEPSGKFYLTINLATQAEIPKESIPNSDDCITIDFGTGHTLAYADKPVFNGKHTFDSPKTLQNAQKRLKQLQKAMSRKYRMNKKKDETWADCKTKNWEKNRIKVAKLHERVANLRNQTIHELTNYIIDSEYNTICYEHFNIKNMMQREMPVAKTEGVGFEANNRSIKKFFRLLLSDASISEIDRVLTYKAKWKGKTVVKSPEGSYTFRECNKCTYINEDLPIGKKLWNCQNCGKEHTKGKNSVILIKRKAFEVLN